MASVDHPDTGSDWYSGVEDESWWFPGIVVGAVLAHLAYYLNRDRHRPQ